MLLINGTSDGNPGFKAEKTEHTAGTRKNKKQLQYRVSDFHGNGAGIRGKIL